MTLIRILGFAVLLSCVACQKEISSDTTGDPASPLNGSLRMKIDGEQWVADQGLGAFIMNDRLHVSGFSADKKYFHITLDDDIPGTYVLNQSSLSAAALTDSNSTTNYAFTTNQGEDEQFAGGVVVVTSIDQQKKTVSGTFQFKMYREFDSTQIVITEGVFEKVTYLTSIPPTATTDTFKVQIDNAPWSGAVVAGVVVQDQLFVSGTATNGVKSVALVMPLDVEPGEFEMEAFSDFMGLYAPDLNTSLSSQTGKLTVIAHDKTAKRITGRFEFTATDLLNSQSVILSDGYFSLTYK